MSLSSASCPAGISHCDPEDVGTVLMRPPLCRKAALLALFLEILPCSEILGLGSFEFSSRSFPKVLLPRGPIKARPSGPFLQSWAPGARAIPRRMIVSLILVLIRSLLVLGYLWHVLQRERERAALLTAEGVVGPVGTIIIWRGRGLAFTGFVHLDPAARCLHL